jgi:aqualysin 1
MPNQFRSTRFRISVAGVAFIAAACGPGEGEPQDSSASSSTLSPAATVSGPPQITRGSIPGRFFVVLKQAGGVAAVTREQRVAIANELALRAGAQRADIVFRRVLPGFVISNVDSARVAALQNDPRVDTIVADRYASIAANARDTQEGAPWGLDRIDSATGLDQLFSYTSSGDGVDVYVFDTGIYAVHDEFAGRASVFWDRVGDDRKGEDCHGHGTHVAGIIGGTKYGVAKRVRLHAARVLGCDGRGPWSTIIAAMDSLTIQQFATPARRVVVANMSIEGDGPFAPLDSAFANARRAGILFVTVSGNSDSDACAQSTAHSGATLRVAASTRSDERATFSNWGDCVDLFAPGVDIESAAKNSPTATSTLSGTSMAAPHVAGVAAQYLAASPRASVEDVRTAVLSAALTRIRGAKSPHDKLLFTNF